MPGELSSSCCNLKDVIQYLRNFSAAEQEVLSQVVKLVRLILVNPATNAISEGSFSAMRRIKTYLRSTMGQSRLNAVMVLHIHKEKTDKTSVVDNSGGSDHRKTVFGKFSEADLQLLYIRKYSYVHVVCFYMHVIWSCNSVACNIDTHDISCRLFNFKTLKFSGGLCPPNPLLSWGTVSPRPPQPNHSR